LRRAWHLLGWFVVVGALITMFGATTAPLLLSLAADCGVGLLIIRGWMEMRAAMVAAPTASEMPLFLSSPAAAIRQRNGDR
jgi:hypothetical protein